MSWWKSRPLLSRIEGTPITSWRMHLVDRKLSVTTLQRGVTASQLGVTPLQTWRNGVPVTY